MTDQFRSYLGCVEDPTHEFKGPDASIDAILAAIVAFLNTDGGEVVVGVDAGGPESVASAEPGVAEPHVLKDRLDHAISSRVDPPPPATAIDVTVVRTPVGNALVRIVVAESMQGPHALRQGNTATFWVREGAHRRALSVAETFARVRQTGTEPDILARSNVAFRPGIECASAAANAKAPALFVGFFPDSAPRHPESAWTKIRERIGSSLRSEAPLGVRRGGFTFALWPHWEPEVSISRDLVALGRGRPLYRIVEVQRSGAVWGAWSHELDSKAVVTRTGVNANMIPAIVIAEFVVSVAKLAMYSMMESGISGNVAGRVVLFSNAPVLLHGPGELATFPAQVAGQPLMDLPIDTGPITMDSVMNESASADLVRELLARWFDLAGNPEAWRAFRDQNGWRFP